MMGLHGASQPRRVPVDHSRVPEEAPGHTCVSKIYLQGMGRKGWGVRQSRGMVEESARN